MAEVDFMEEEVEERDPNPLLQIAHRVLLAGIGAVALAQEEIEEFVERLVERGEIAEKDGRRILNDVLSRRRRQSVDESQNGSPEVVAEAGSEMDKRVEGLLHRMNIPTKTDIDALGLKISALTEKVEQLKTAQAE